MYVPAWFFIKIAERDGNPTPEFDNFLNVLTTQMQLNLSQDGFAIPTRTTEQINQIFADTEKPKVLMAFDSTTNELKIRDINGNTRIIPMI